MKLRICKFLQFYLLFIMVSSSAFAADYAQRFPTSTALEVLTPTRGDDEYLRLDTTNDPIVGNLSISPGSLSVDSIFNNGLTSQALNGVWTLTGIGAYTNDLKFELGSSTTVGKLYSTTGLTELNIGSADNFTISMGDSGATDYYQMFDGTNPLFYTSGSFRFSANRNTDIFRIIGLNGNYFQFDHDGLQARSSADAAKNFYVNYYGGDVNFCNSLAIVAYDSKEFRLYGDNYALTMGASGVTDYYQKFDGTNAKFYTSGAMYFDTRSLIVQKDQDYVGFQFGESATKYGVFQWRNTAERVDFSTAYLDYRILINNLLYIGTDTDKGIGIGVEPSSTYLIKAYRGFTETSGIYYGQYMYPNLNLASDGTTTLRCHGIAPTMAGSKNASTVTGMFFQPTVAHTAGTLSSLEGIRIEPYMADVSAGTITNYYGILQYDFTKHASSTETLTTGYQQYIAQLTKAGTNWQIYSVAGNNYFGEGSHSFVGDINLPDADKMSWGTAKDASIYYDATDLVINPKEVGAGKVSISGSVTVPTTTDDNIGVIYKGSDRFIHDYHNLVGGGAIPVGQNTFVGVNAGNFTMGSTATSTSHASYNTGVGNGTLQANTTGYQNSAFGYSSLYSNSVGYLNSAFGYKSLYSNTEGVQNSVFGHTSLYSNTTGSSNTANGYATLYTSKTGSSGVAIGTESQRYANDTETPWTNYNTSVGYQALRGSTTAANNTGIANTALGYQTLLVNTSGEFNNAVGYLSLTANTTGSYNQSFGYYSLQNNTQGNSNVAIGGGTLNANTTASYNTAVGNGALYGNTTGAYNTALGYQAGHYILGGVTANTTSDYSVYLGSSTKASADNAQNEIILGYNAIGQGSNTIIFGNTSMVGAYFLADNYKTYWGAGKDVSTYFDGSDWIFNSENITANDEVHFTNFDAYIFDNLIEATTLNTGSGAMDLGDAAVANGDTDSIPTGDQVYDFCETTQDYFKTSEVTGNLAGVTHHLYKTIMDPLGTQTEDNEICLIPATDAAITITRIVVTLDSAANEVAGDVKFADTFIGLANATVVETFDTTSGVRDDSSMSGDATIPSGKCVYLSFDSAPSTDIHSMTIDIVYDYD